MRSFEFLSDRYFVQPVRTRWLDPLLMLSHTWEIDNANRFCPQTVIVHLFPLPFGLAWGRWESTDPERHRAVLSTHVSGGADIEYDRYLAINDPISRSEWERRQRKARAIIAANALDPDDEMMLMQQMDLMS